MSLRIWKGPTEQVIEAPDSPSYDLGQDSVSCSRTYFGLYATAKNSILPRGTVGTGEMAGWIVSRCQLNRQRGGVGKLVIQYGAGGAGGASSGQALPPDEMSIEPFEINPSLEKNKRYLTGGTYPLTDADYQKVELALKAFENPGSTAITLTTGQNDLYTKKKRGQTSFYMSGFKYTWTASYWWMTGSVNLGGIIQAPSGPLASFLPSSFTALRTADDLKWTGTMFKYTRSWMIFPGAASYLQLDPDLY